MRRLFENAGVFAGSGVRAGFVAIMAALILGGLAQSVFPFIQIAPLEEFRSPAPRPKVVDKLLHGDGRLAPDINAWFDDRMGFRAVLTRLANQIDYSVFSYSKKVVIGAGGWLFSPEYMQATIKFAQASGLVRERANIFAVKKYLDRKNIRLVIVSVPAKEIIYSDKLPASAPTLPSVTEFDNFTAFLREHDNTDWIYVDGRDVVKREQAKSFDLYYRTDPHMTAFGNLLVAREMVNRIAIAEHVAWRWNPEFTFSPTTFDGAAYARFLGIFSSVAETNMFPSPSAMTNPATPTPDGFFDKTPPEPFETIFHSKVGTSKLPQTLLFGSSFVDWYVALGAFSNFESIYRVRGDIMRLETALRAIPPGTRYFIFHFWDQHLSQLNYVNIPKD